MKNLKLFKDLLTQKQRTKSIYNFGDFDSPQPFQSECGQLSLHNIFVLF